MPVSYVLSLAIRKYVEDNNGIDDSNAIGLYNLSQNFVLDLSDDVGDSMNTNDILGTTGYTVPCIGLKTKTHQFEFNDNVESLEFKIARINAKLKEFEQNWQQFLLKEWMNKVTSFFDAIGLGALTAWITFDFCDFMKIIGIPTTIDLSSFSGIKQIEAQTSTLSQKAINPPAEGA